jgi:methyl-accepting chemotaxis protein
MLGVASPESLARRVHRQEEDLQAIADTVLDIKDTVDQHSEILVQHSEILVQHTETLNQHTETLNQHTETLNQHTETLNQHTETLNQHTEELATIRVMLADHGSRLDRIEDNQRHQGDQLTEILTLLRGRSPAGDSVGQ